MRTRAIAAAASIAALSFTAVPIAQAATISHHKAAVESRLDRSGDARGTHHLDQPGDSSRDSSSADHSLDVRDR